MINVNSSANKRCVLCMDMEDTTDRGLLNFNYRIKSVDMFKNMKKYTLISICKCEEVVHRICFYKKLFVEQEFKCHKCEATYLVDLLLENKSVFGKLSFTNRLGSLFFLFLAMLSLIGLVVLNALIEYANVYEFWRIIVYIVLFSLILIDIVCIYYSFHKANEENCLERIMFTSEDNEPKIVRFSNIAKANTGNALFSRLVCNSMDVLSQKATMRALMSFLQYKLNLEQHEITQIKLDSDILKALTLKKEYTGLLPEKKSEENTARNQNSQTNNTKTFNHNETIKLNSKRKISETRYFMRLLQNKNKRNLTRSSIFDQMNIPSSLTRGATNDDKDKEKHDKQEKLKLKINDETIKEEPLEHSPVNFKSQKSVKKIKSLKSLKHIDKPKDTILENIEYGQSSDKINNEQTSYDKLKTMQKTDLTTENTPLRINNNDTTNMNTNITGGRNNYISIHESATNRIGTVRDERGLNEYRIFENRDLLMNFYSEESEIALHSERSKAILLNISDSSIEYKN